MLEILWGVHSPFVGAELVVKQLLLLCLAYATPQRHRPPRLKDVHCRERAKT